MMMVGWGVQISAADGGYIVQWMEPRSAPQNDAGPGYLEQEGQMLSGCLPGQRFQPPKHRRAVRVKLEDALKLAGEILTRLEKATVDDPFDPPEAFISPA